MPSSLFNATGGLTTEDFDTLAELNAILLDATLDDISGTRVPSVHTHVEVDITDLFDNGITLDDPGAPNKEIIFNRADTTTVQGFRFRLAGAERWTFQQAIGSEDLLLNNTNSTGDWLITPLGSVIHQGKINGNVVSIDRGSDGHTADLQQYQTFAQVVVASMSIAGKQTVKSLEIVDGPFIWDNGTEQTWQLRTSTSVINEDFMLQAQGSGRAAILSLYTADGGTTDNVAFRALSNATPDSIANREVFFMGYLAASGRLEMFSNAAGSGTFRSIAHYVSPDTDQLVLTPSNTISSQGVTIIDGSGQHVGIFAGTAVAVVFGGTGASTAAAARTNLGLVIGSDVQADLDLVSQVDAEAGTATDERVWSALRVAQAIAALASAGSPAVFYAESEGLSTTTTTDYSAQKLRLTFTAEAADYIIAWSIEHKIASGTKESAVRLQQDDTTVINEDLENDHTEFQVASGFRRITLTAASHDFDLDFKSSDSTVASVQRARISATKVVAG